MKDQLGREIDYLRISVTDRCNLRCRYCMPEDGVPLLDHEDVLSFEEIERICRIGAGLGIRKIKITGGEPLARRNVAKLVRAIASIPGIEDITMTSNGCLLGSCAKELKQAGLSGINISLDTLVPETFAYLTRRDAFDQVMEGIELARKAGLSVKLNCAVTDCMDKDTVLAFAEFSAAHKLPVRFIEMMPIGEGKSYESLDNAALFQILKEYYPDIRATDAVRGNGPAVYYEFSSREGSQSTGYVGFISAVHHKFCNSCNRVRLTSDGFLKLCLDSDAGVDVRELMRNGIGDSELESRMAAVISSKPESHHFGVCQEGLRSGKERNMNQIGG